MLSLRNRLVLVFFAVTFVAIGALYLYVAPGLQNRLLDEKVTALSTAASQQSGAIEAALSTATPRQLQNLVNEAALQSGDRVSLIGVGSEQGGQPFIGTRVDSPGAQGLALTLAYRSIQGGKPVSGTEHSGTIAEAAYPMLHNGVGWVIAFSSPVADVVHNVATVRHEILIAGAIALLLALAGGYVVARWLAQRVKRLELAAEQVAAGDFSRSIRVDSRDELGQLAVAFNDMQRQLAQLESAREKFIATASHELRTPIFSLGGFVELLEDEDLDPDTRRRFLDQIRAQVERLRKLSVDLLDLSSLEAGSLELREEQVDFGELTRSVSGEFEPSLQQHDSHLELRLVGGTIEAHCDPVRVAQIVRILIDNALVHNPPGTRIEVTAGRVNGRVRLAVRDDGGGIDHSALSRVFEPFYTADDAQGSGLGLAIASELAERMSGRLSVTSQPGRTVFELELPT